MPRAIGVALKAVCLRPEFDALRATVTLDDRYLGLSDMDRAALEWALRLGERWSLPVVAVTAGPGPAEGVLRDAASVGAEKVIRVDLDPTSASPVVAASLAAVFLHEDADVVLCGAHSLDRASGSVPAFLAHEMLAAQALGLVAIDPAAGADERSLRVVRRLDGGRREILEVSGPVVCSLEGATARLRRASLSATLNAADRPVEVRPSNAGSAAATGTPLEGQTRPFRPRAHRRPAPVGGTALERVLSLTQAAVPRDPPRTVEVDPQQAADLILDQLRQWGELEGL